MDGTLTDAKTFGTYEDAENVVAELLLLHPDWMGQISIETLRSALDRGRV